MPKFCKDCGNAQVVFCPHCTELMYFCLSVGNAYEEFAEACQFFEENNG